MTAHGVTGPIVALTGTPGTGKTDASARLRAKGIAVLDLARFVGDPRFDRGADEGHHGAVTLDEGALSDHLREHLSNEVGPGTGPVFLDSHFAHEIDIVDRILILRCSPAVLAERLRRRGWPEAKVRENVEAEAIDLILQESLEVAELARDVGVEVPIGEIDTTHRTPDETASLALALATAEPEKLEIGTVDWSGEVLGWY